MFWKSIQQRRMRQAKVCELRNKLDILILEAESTAEQDMTPSIRLRTVHRLIVDQLAALRLEQAEDRLSNNLVIAAVAAISAVSGALVTCAWHLFGNL